MVANTTKMKLNEAQKESPYGIAYAGGVADMVWIKGQQYPFALRSGRYTSHLLPSIRIKNSDEWEPLTLAMINSRWGPWFLYEIKVYDGEELLYELIIPGVGNDWPTPEQNPSYANLIELFGGVGYEVRIKTRLIDERMENPYDKVNWEK